ncbi:hypothetical protein QYE76_023878 [Lolium multiflorum]|uniref:Uncharacterized protein n=1 Tax=Lolium multiflorum TaxID=4521 RepID=A0AAD8RCM6_LOLMU|nr:hypothetical protein QYE76_023878 [Lolium multiflorum]
MGLGRRGTPQPTSPLYKEGRGQGRSTPKTPNSAAPLSSFTIVCSGLAKPCRFFSSTSTTTPSCCWDSEGIYHTSAARWNGEGKDFTDTIMVAPTINLNQFLEKAKLKNNGTNFTDWFRHVRIVLTSGNLQYVLDAPLGPPPFLTATDEVKNVYLAQKQHYSQVQCAILYGLEAELQKRFETHDPCEIIRELKAIFETHAALESYEASKHFFGGMMEQGSSVSEHVLKMSGHAKKLNDLGIVIPNQLGIHRVLQSLPPSYKNFVMNYNMQNMNKELHELFSMLKSAEVEIHKEHQVLMVNKTTSFKKQGKPNNKDNFKSEGKIFVAKNGSFLEKEFLTKEVTGRKVELGEVIEPSLEDQSSAAPEVVLVQPAPIREEANDDDHETSNEEATETRRSTRERTTPDCYDPYLNVMIVDNNDEDPNDEEAMMSPIPTNGKRP